MFGSWHNSPIVVDLVLGWSIGVEQPSLTRLVDQFV
jgi:hypothetical protein